MGLEGVGPSVDQLTEAGDDGRGGIYIGILDELHVRGKGEGAQRGVGVSGAEW